VRLDALPEGLLDYIAFLDAPLEDESDAEGLADALLSRWEGMILVHLGRATWQAP
jgi:hypothetical protein